MAFSKLSKSFSAKKIRTPEEINKEYNENAVQYGHKSRQIVTLQQHVENLKAEMTGHLRRMGEIQEEADKTPAKPQEVPLQSPSQEMSQEQEHA
jgi:hypothetical protein